MKPDKVAWINTWLVDSPYYIGLCKSEEAFRRELRRMRIPSEKWPEWLSKRMDGATHSFISDKGGLRLIVCVKKKKTSDVIGILIHEAVHVWQDIKEELGEDKPGCEFEAYAIEAIAQRLIAAYRK